MVWSAGLAPVKFVDTLTNDEAKADDDDEATRDLVDSSGVGTGGVDSVSSKPLFASGPGGRLVVDPFLRVPGTGGRVFAAGDCALNPENPLPPTANAAEQQGAYLAKCFNQYYKDHPASVGASPATKEEEALISAPPGNVVPSGMPFQLLEPLDKLLFKAQPEFRYVERGKMASMGFGRGVTDLSKSELLGDKVGPLNTGETLTGFAAFFSWRAAYLTKQLSWKNRILVPMFWFKSAVFGRDISRF